ncbi:MAG: hypothetical protein HY241_00390 [Actinobacteria bacterium]|nr:hypothetical protein [Actinomycetota bacterium]
MLRRMPLATGWPGPTHPRWRVAATLLIVPVLVAGGGCARKTTGPPPPPPPVAGGDVAAFIDRKLAATLAPLVVGPAACPERLALIRDKAEFCVITVEGEPVRIRVLRADNGLYTAANDQAIVPVQKLEEALVAQASQKAGVPVRVDCGDHAVLVVDPPESVQCVAHPTGRQQLLLDVTINDLAGSFSFAEHQNAGG